MRERKRERERERGREWKRGRERNEGENTAVRPTHLAKIEQ